ncbi:hypothetical protein [Cupriavidus pauculus]|uniref:Uncharacterized protein n=1 Tax=Cupriavidus pauculus TaxID=82633 RepID=A0A3G8GZY2_9BURK|nr:hypothetical protein [Cupriavidus pauculus]AZG13803.1 hypothetical protein EHF44_10275 [Cupriavidus pauculus]
MKSEPFQSCAELSELFPEGITRETSVSKKSKFGHDEWDFTDNGNPRLLHYTHSNLIIAWHTKTSQAFPYTPLPDAIILVLKLLALLLLRAPHTVNGRSKAKSNNHPTTVCGYMRPLIAFFGHLNEKSLLEEGTLAPISTLSDVTLKHLRESLSDWNVGRGSDLRRLLKMICSPIIKNTCKGFSPHWSGGDIRLLSFRPNGHRENYEPVIPNALFQHISKCATNDVVGFLRFMREHPASDVPGEIPIELSDISRRSYGREAHEAYIQHIQSKTKQALEEIKKFGVSLGVLRDYHIRVHHAACSLICLYTGGRYTDLRGFKKGCLKKIGGMWFISGTHIKHQDINKPADMDFWPAIPILRDALKCLEHFSELTFNQYLVAGLQLRDEPGPYSPNGLAGALQNYVKRIDANGAWEHTSVSSQRCRHTLAYQLARADLGLVFISHQLKHLHSALRAAPPQVTLNYGRISELKFEQALFSPGLHYELAESLYDPDSPLAGGGASEFSQRRKQYFEGLLASGMTKEEILERLAGQPIPLSSVGMGFCLGKREIKNKDGSIQKPPCIGSLMCAPDTCSNAVITTHHVHMWKKVVTQNEELAACPTMQHAKTELVSTANRAREILAGLGVSE